MKFSDNLVREKDDYVNVKLSDKEFRKRDLHNYLNTDIVKNNIAFDKAENSPIHLYSIPAGDLKIGESIYDENGDFLSYRSS